MLAEATKSRLIEALRRKTVRQKAPLNVIVLVVLGLLFGGALGFVIARYFTIGTVAGSKPLTAALFLLMLPVAFLLTVLIHEGGHVLGGLLAGMRFFMLAAGPFLLTREGGRVKLRWGNPLGLWGGFASMGPANLEGLNRQMLSMTSGGPLASLLMTGLSALLAFAELPAALHLLVRLLFLCNAGVAFATLIPSRAGGMVSDGGRLLMLFRGGRAAQRWCRLAAVNSQIQGPVRPRDLEPELFDRVWGGDREAAVDEFAFACLTFYWAFDCGDVERAAEELIFVLDHATHVSPLLEHYLRFEALFLLAYEGSTPIAQAAEWVESKFITMTEEQWRLQAALAHLAGDHAAAKTAAEKALGLMAQDGSGVNRWKADVLQQLAA